MINYYSKLCASLLIGKSNERILCKLIEPKWNFKVVFTRLCCHWNYKNVKFYLIVNQNLSSVYFSLAKFRPACELQPFSCHDLANDIYSETAKTVLSHLKWIVLTWVTAPRAGMFVFIFDMLCKNWFGEVNMEVRFEVFIYLFSVAKEKCQQQSMLWVQKIVTPSLPDRTKRLISNRLSITDRCNGGCNKLIFVVLVIVITE